MYKCLKLRSLPSDEEAAFEALPENPTVKSKLRLHDAAESVSTWWKPVSKPQASPSLWDHFHSGESAKPETVRA